MENRHNFIESTVIAQPYAPPAAATATAASPMFVFISVAVVAQPNIILID